MQIKSLKVRAFWKAVCVAKRIFLCFCALYYKHTN